MPRTWLRGSTYWGEDGCTGWTIRRDGGTLRITGNICDLGQLDTFIHELIANRTYFAGGKIDGSVPTIDTPAAAGDTARTYQFPSIKPEPHWLSTPPEGIAVAHTVTPEEAAREAFRTRGYVEPYHDPYTDIAASLGYFPRVTTKAAALACGYGHDRERRGFARACYSLLRRLTGAFAPKSIANPYFGVRSKSGADRAPAADHDG